MMMMMTTMMMIAVLLLILLLIHISITFVIAIVSIVIDLVY